VKLLLIATTLFLAFSLAAVAQEADQSPASKADIQTYFETVHSHDQVKKIMDAMLRPMHQMIHERYLKDKDKLPADFEERMTKQIDDMLKNMPMDEMMQATIPVYQKHFTKGDINALLAFYSSPTGQKLLLDMPNITAESMSAMMPILSRYIEDIQRKLQADADQMVQESEKKSEPASQ
jgi:hypothetical protein